VLLSAANVSAYTQSLSDCQAFAALFSDTCSSTVLTTSDISTATGTTLTCTGTASICVSDSTKTDVTACAHNHVLCVTCTEESSVVYIRVQSNSLPNHCWTTSFIENVVEYQTQDFKTIWNSNVYSTSNYLASAF